MYGRRSTESTVDVADNFHCELDNTPSINIVTNAAAVVPDTASIKLSLVHWGYQCH